jgi:16S rRNA (cytidine1402-2'-O)-methyltransferase
MTAARGRLLLVPNALDLGHDAVALDAVLPADVLQTAAAITHWAVEDARSARAFLKRVAARAPLALPLQQLSIVELPRPRKGVKQPTHAPGAPRRPTPAASDARGAASDPWHALLAPALAGHDLGLLSEAGLPAVADPGAALVAAAHAAGLTVLPLAGPSALLLALAASGLEGNRFAFVGYLPQTAPERALRLRELEAHSRRDRQTQIVIETPYRNQALFDAMLTALAPGTRLAVAIGLTLPEGWCRTAEVAAWRGAPPRLSDHLPAVFCLLG